jgi:thiamine biosynthesis protein ThiS
MQQRTIRLTLNGEPHELAAPITVEALLERLEIDPRRCAVERNKELVKKARYADTLLADGDLIEIVTLVGGG